MAATETIHCFEAAGLGKAPFSYAGMVVQDISYGMRNITVGGVQCQTKPGGTCQYCGTYIVNMFNVESADGKQFHVGCECIRKTGDSGLIRKVEEDVKIMERKKRAARKAKQNADDKELCESTNLASFAGKPHPTPTRAANGETLADWMNWMREWKNYGTLARVIRAESKEVS